MIVRQLGRLAAVAVAASLAPTARAVGVKESWVDQLDGPASMNDCGESIAVAPDGSIYVAGLIFQQVQANLFAPRFITIKYDDAGTRLWTRTYAGTFGSGAAAAKHVAVDAQGMILVSGSTNQGDDWAVVKYDPSGTQLWATVYVASSSYLTEPDGMALDAQGNVYLVGDVGVGTSAGALVKISSAGVPQWARLYSGPASQGGSFCAVAVDGSGGIYVAGSAVVPGKASELCVARYDAAGTLLWTLFDGSIGQFTHDRATAISVDGAGTAHVAGCFGSNSAPGLDLVIAKVTSAGSKLWRRTYMGPAGFDDAAADVAVDGAGNAVVVGYSGVDFDDADAITLKYDSAGTLLWEQRVIGDEIHLDRATSLALDANANVYVAGGYDPIGGQQYFTARYGPDGAAHWFMTYAGPLGGGSIADDVALGPQGNVYVTGDSPDQGTGFDIATLGYAQTPEAVPGDVDGDGAVNVVDMVALVLAWGPCAPPPAACPADVNSDGTVDVVDLVALVLNWS
jgi:hypothetical protein